jgi:hypothetical protein
MDPETNPLRNKSVEELRALVSTFPTPKEVGMMYPESIGTPSNGYPD